MKGQAKPICNMRLANLGKGLKKKNREVEPIQPIKK